MSTGHKLNEGKLLWCAALMLGLLGPWTALGSPVRAASPSTGSISIRPGPEALLGDPITVDVTGLPAKQAVTIHARRRDPQNQLAYSVATYTSDANGRVSTAESAAIRGSYTGVDPTGLFWSMQTVTDTATFPAVLPPLAAEASKHTEIAFDVEVGGAIVTSGQITTVAVSPDVKVEPASADGLVAEFYYPVGKTSLPTVVVVGGSEGGISTAGLTAGLLASKGYAALALAYFGGPGLPKELVEIPLEYFGKAIDWAGRQEVVNKDRLALYGTSKGAELVLLLGATYPAVKAVVAVSPSDVVWQGLSQDTTKLRSSWTYQGQPVPFVPFKITDAFNQQFAKGMPAAIDYLSIYAEGLKDADAVRQAAIKVENIGGPLLLISGDDDHVWPSGQMANQIVDRLKANHSASTSLHLTYPNAGHLYGIPGYLQDVKVPFVRGGTPQGNGMAQAALWAAGIKFLDENLR